MGTTSNGSMRNSTGCRYIDTPALYIYISRGFDIPSLRLFWKGAVETGAGSRRAGPLHEEYRPPSGSHGAQASDLDQDGLDSRVGES